MHVDPKKAALSDYNFCFRKVKEIEFLCIEDRNMGRMSVTNNIENIAERIFIENSKTLVSRHNFKIIYADSEGIWDGFNLVDMEFISLQQKGWLQAALKMIKENL